MRWGRRRAQRQDFFLSPVRWGRRRAQQPAFSPYPQRGEADATTATSSLSLTPVRWGRGSAQRPALSTFPQWGEADGQHSDQHSLPIPNEVKQTAIKATSSLFLSPHRWGRRRAQRQDLSPYSKWGEEDSEQSDQLSLPYPSEVRQTGSIATSSLSISRSKRPALSSFPHRGEENGERPSLSPYPKWSEENGEQSDQLSLPFPIEAKQTASTTISSLSISPVRWGRRQTPRPVFSPYPKWGE